TGAGHGIRGVLTGEGDAGGRRERPVDPGEAAVRVHTDALAGDHGIRLTDEPGGPEDESVVRPALLPDGAHEHPPGHRLAEGVMVWAGVRGDGAAVVGAGLGGGERVVLQQGAARDDPAAEPLPGAGRGGGRYHRVDEGARPVAG